MLIDAEYIEMMTGLEAESFTEEILVLAEAKAKQMIGFLIQEIKTKPFYIYNSTYLLNLNEPTAVVTEVKLREAPGDYTVVDANEYRYVDGIIKFERMIYEDSDVVVTYNLGWTTVNLPELVKLLLVYISLDVLNSLQPGAFQTSDIESKKIGDYSIKYHISTNEDKGDESSFYQRMDKLVALIKQGSFESGATN